MNNSDTTTRHPTAITNDRHTPDTIASLQAKVRALNDAHKRALEQEAAASVRKGEVMVAEALAESKRTPK